MASLQRQLADFAAERDWQRFHSPKNLAMALAAEAGELLDLMQWLTEEESRNLDTEQREAVGFELADILLYLLRLADQAGVDLERSVVAKMRINADKYPVSLARGNATKYNRRERP